MTNYNEAIQNICNDINNSVCPMVVFNNIKALGGKDKSYLDIMDSIIGVVRETYITNNMEFKVRVNGKGKDAMMLYTISTDLYSITIAVNVYNMVRLSVDLDSAIRHIVQLLTDGKVSEAVEVIRDLDLHDSMNRYFCSNIQNIVLHKDDIVKNGNIICSGSGSPYKTIEFVSGSNRILLEYNEGTSIYDISTGDSSSDANNLNSFISTLTKSGFVLFYTSKSSINRNKHILESYYFNRDMMIACDIVSCGNSWTYRNFKVPEGEWSDKTALNLNMESDIVELMTVCTNRRSSVKAYKGILLSDHILTAEEAQAYVLSIICKGLSAMSIANMDYTVFTHMMAAKIKKNFNDLKEMAGDATDAIMCGLLQSKQGSPIFEKIIDNIGFILDDNGCNSYRMLDSSLGVPYNIQRRLNDLAKKVVATKSESAFDTIVKTFNGIYKNKRVKALKYFIRRLIELDEIETGGISTFVIAKDKHYSIYCENCVIELDKACKFAEVVNDEQGC